VLLEVRNLEVHYGGIRAVTGVSVDIAEGELVCLIGANGAGKTSTLKAICGLIASKDGSVRYCGEDISRAPVHELPRKGLVMVPEGRGIFAQLTVEENLAMGAYAHGGAHLREAAAAQYARFPRLAERRRQIAGTLSGGEQQMLALARALMTRPKLLLLDEPSAGLAPVVVQQVFELVKRIRASGLTVLIVEQNVQQVLKVVDRAYLLEAGTIRASGTSEEMMSTDTIKQAYLGV
jgi:branched-chain amino acid transport system ATP-binding protein